VEYCITDKNKRIVTSLLYPVYIWNNIPSSKNTFDLDTSYKIVRLAIPRVCDTLRDSTTISWLNPILASPIIKLDSSYCDSTQGAVRLSIRNVSDYKSYRWTWTGDTTSYQYTNTYRREELTVTNLCHTQRFILPAAYCPLMPIGLPSAFSPNGDGLNDNWSIQGAKNIKVHYLQVFNRWGILIFSTTNPNISWDGKYRGEIAPAGVYSYILDYEYTPHKIRREQNGSVSIVR
jgi:gliding motility-associated-like protein